jgi:hypothetical protein
MSKQSCRNDKPSIGIVYALISFHRLALVSSCIPGVRSCNDKVGRLIYFGQMLDKDSALRHRNSALKARPRLCLR